MTYEPTAQGRSFYWIPSFALACFVLPLAADEPAPAPVDVSVFTGPELKKFPQLERPKKRGSEEREAWANVNYMVDREGKAYAISIVDSSGDEEFESAVIKSVQRATFAPAKQGGIPVDSSDETKVVRQSSNARGARRTFRAAYESLLSAIEAGNQAAALEQLGKLEATSLHEDAYTSFARFYYHRKWGTDAEQLADLRRAIAYEKRPGHLTKPVFVEMLKQMLRLEVNRQELGSALRTWETLLPLLTAAEAALWQPTIDRIETIRAGDQIVRTPGDMLTRSSWGTQLLRNRFEIAVAHGHISEIKLYCQKRYVFFEYESGVQYTVDAASIGSKPAGNKDRTCYLQLVGEPGTRFELIQP